MEGIFQFIKRFNFITKNSDIALAVGLILVLILMIMLLMNLIQIVVTTSI